MEPLKSKSLPQSGKVELMELVELVELIIEIHNIPWLQQTVTGISNINSHLVNVFN